MRGAFQKQQSMRAVAAYYGTVLLSPLRALLLSFESFADCSSQAQESCAQKPA